MGQIVDDDHRKDREPHDGADRQSLKKASGAARNRNNAFGSRAGSWSA